jgi:hypothetical protein
MDFLCVEICLIAVKPVQKEALVKLLRSCQSFIRNLQTLTLTFIEPYMLPTMVYSQEAYLNTEEIHWNTIKPYHNQFKEKMYDFFLTLF